MSYTKAEIANKCKKCAFQVGPLPDGVDAAQLLWALAGVESSFGADCTPRHEPAYDVGGKYSTHAPMPTLLKMYGTAAACSYGPWQVMFVNMSLGTRPAALDDLDVVASETVLHLNRLLRHWHPSNLNEIGECWNAGHITPDPDYERKLTASYAVPLPTTP